MRADEAGSLSINLARGPSTDGRRKEAGSDRRWINGRSGRALGDREGGRRHAGASACSVEGRSCRDRREGDLSEERSGARPAR